MKGSCPNCGKEGTFGIVTYRVARCSKCMHRGDTRTFKK